jgi:argininosuccinate lyase
MPERERPVLWAGRLADQPEDEAFAFQASFTVDKRLAREDIACSRAHAAMLSRQGIIPASEAARIDRELARIEEELAGTGQPRSSNHGEEPSVEAEDIHSYIETLLTQRLGDAGRMLQTGRSRNDQVATDFRACLLRRVPEIRNEIAETVRVILNRAEEHLETLMPGYTHLQRAQPVTLAFHLTAWASALSRDRERFADARARIDDCPLGSGALAGSGLPLDRNFTAQALGFTRVNLNAMDGVASRDFALETASACSIAMIHLSRFCEDLALWASGEFGYVEFADAWSTGSSLMPQKKNPDFAELIRGKSGRAVGNLVTLLTMLKGLPYAYNKDMQEDKEALFDSLDTLYSCLRMFRGMLKSAAFNAARMEAACLGGFIEAVDAAEYLVRKGTPFRAAHETVALVVRDCIAAGQKSIGERSLEELRTRSPLFGEDVFERLKPFVSVRARNIAGGPAPEETLRQINILRERLV